MPIEQVSRTHVYDESGVAVAPLVALMIYGLDAFEWRFIQSPYFHWWQLGGIAPGIDARVSRGGHDAKRSRSRD
jgi:hypothetical protein